MDKASRELYELKAGVLQAMAHPLRLAILDVLCADEQCVRDIAKRVDAKRSNVSRHLSVMVRAGILGFRKDGLRVIYSLKTPCILGSLDCVAAVLREQMNHHKALIRKL